MIIKYLIRELHTDKNHNTANRLYCKLASGNVKRKEKQFLLYDPQPPWPEMLSHPWKLSRLRSGSWTDTVPFFTPFLNVYCLLLSGWHKSLTWHQGHKESEGKDQQASTSDGCVPNSELIPESAAS